MATVEWWCSVAKSCLTLWNPRLPCPSLSPRVCSNSCPLSQWYHPTISSSGAALHLLPSIFSSITVFSNVLALTRHIGWGKSPTSLYHKWPHLYNDDLHIHFTRVWWWWRAIHRWFFYYNIRWNNRVKVWEDLLRKAEAHSLDILCIPEDHDPALTALCGEVGYQLS